MADFGNRNNGFFGGEGGGSTPITLPLPISDGGTGSSTQNFVDLSNTQTVGGAKTFSTSPTLSSLTASQIMATDSTKQIQALGTTTYPSLTELSYVKGVTSAIQTQINSKLSNTEVVLGYQGLGSTIKASPIGLNLSLAISTATTLVDTRLILTPVYLATTSTITGVKWYQSVIGNYVADAYNGVGLYSVSGGTITLIASSTNDGTIWQTFASNTWGNKAFSSPLTNQVAGTYFIGALYNVSGTATATPSIVTITSSIITVQPFDFTGGRLSAVLLSQSTLPSPLTLSTTTSLVSTHWLSLY